MITQRTTAHRAQALRAAREAKAARDATRIAREQRIETVLADFYEASRTADRIRTDARDRANRIQAEAENKAHQADTDARHAVRELRGLGQTNAEIAELCGISVATARAMANEQDTCEEATGEHGTRRHIKERSKEDTRPAPEERDVRAEGEHADTGDDARPRDLPSRGSTPESEQNRPAG